MVRNGAITFQNYDFHSPYSKDTIRCDCAVSGDERPR